MASIFCPVCPNPNDLVTIADMTCPINWADIDRIIFQKVAAAPITKVNAALLATWTTKFALLSSDVDKAVITPRSSLMDFKPEATNWIKAKTNADGIDTILGIEPTNFKGKFMNLDTTAEAQIRLLMCNYDLKAYFVDITNKIIGVSSGLNLEGFAVVNSTIGEMPMILLVISTK